MDWSSKEMVVNYDSILVTQKERDKFHVPIEKRRSRKKATKCRQKVVKLFFNSFLVIVAPLQLSTAWIWAHFYALLYFVGKWANKIIDSGFLIYSLQCEDRLAYRQSC